MPVFYRRLPKFCLVPPNTLEEAIRFLADHKGEASLMAGGTDLIPNLKRREIPSPAFVLDLKGITDLAIVGVAAESGADGKESSGR
jgi:4-hydroxybenzoyl-CoA reductase subunit beta